MMRRSRIALLTVVAILLITSVSTWYAWRASRAQLIRTYQVEIGDMLFSERDSPETRRMYCALVQRKLGLYDWEAREAREELVEMRKEFTFD